MKTLFDNAERQELISRLDKLTAENRPLWGKMNSSQMVKHCRLWEEMIHENKLLKRPFIGRLIGQMILKKVLQSPEFRRNSPTIPEMLVTDANIDLNDERRQLITLVNSYPQYDQPDYSFIHPFFGKMTRDQIGKLAYLHLDHHLKQFGV
ncbi:MAG: DUF1569 domain-containing protein [Chitinophagaceae bacterium]|nr:DUF1569 domain-containing protein [Chitinophagaceae bacterium]